MGVLARTIAVLDDDARVLESLQNLLASCGYKADTYSAAELFLTSGAFSRTSCIITDVEMKRMSGLGLLQHVRSRQSDVPVIINTGKPSENSETWTVPRLVSHRTVLPKGDSLRIPKGARQQTKGSRYRRTFGPIPLCSLDSFASRFTFLRGGSSSDA
jgi:CheY-like chemotaxis protein